MSDRPVTGGTRARRAARSGSRPVSGPESSPVEIDPENLAPLEEERDFLLRSIVDLDREHDRGDVAEADYLALRDDYTARAAEVIRSIESGHTGGPDERPTRSWGRILLVAIVVAAVGIGAGLMVARSSGTRMADTSDPTIAGGPRSEVADLLARAREQTGEAQKQLQAGSGDAAVEAYKQAIRAYDDALKIEPTNVDALTYRGWLLHNLAVQTSGPTASELDAQAMGWLDRAVQTDPGFPDARIFRAILLDAAGRPRDAMADLDAIGPSGVPPYLSQLVEQRRAAIAAELSTGAQQGGS